MFTRSKRPRESPPTNMPQRSPTKNSKHNNNRGNRNDRSPWDHRGLTESPPKKKRKMMIGKNKNDEMKLCHDNHNSTSNSNIEPFSPKTKRDSFPFRHQSSPVPRDRLLPPVNILPQPPNHNKNENMNENKDENSNNYGDTLNGSSITSIANTSSNMLTTNMSNININISDKQNGLKNVSVSSNGSSSYNSSQQQQESTESQESKASIGIESAERKIRIENGANEEQEKQKKAKEKDKEKANKENKQCSENKQVKQVKQVKETEKQGIGTGITKRRRSQRLLNRQEKLKNMKIKNEMEQQDSTSSTDISAQTKNKKTKKNKSLPKVSFFR